MRELGVLLAAGVVLAMPGMAQAAEPLPEYALIEPAEGQPFVTGIGSYMRLEIARENAPGHDGTLGDDLLVMPSRLMSERDSAPGRYRTGSVVFSYWNQIPATYYFQIHVSDELYGGVPLHIGPVHSFRIETPAPAAAPPPASTPVNRGLYRAMACNRVRKARAHDRRVYNRRLRAFRRKSTVRRRKAVRKARRSLRISKRLVRQRC